MPDMVRRLGGYTAFFICCFAIITVFNQRPAFAQTAATWQRYNPQDEDFSVLLPEPPLFVQFSRPRRDEDRPRLAGRMYSAYQDGTIFIILSLDNPKNKDSLQDFINESGDEDYPRPGKGSTFDKDIQVSGFNGKQYVFRSERMRAVTQFYLAKERAYIFEVISERWNDDSVKQFFNSIALDKRGKDPVETNANQTTTAATEQRPPAVAGAGETFNSKSVTRKVIVVARPKPIYTEAARDNDVTGTVVLRAVFNSKGQVTNIKAVQGLPDGLTEKAIQAARSIRFFPAIKDDRYVSQYIQIEYNFNLY